MKARRKMNKQTKRLAPHKRLHDLLCYFRETVDILEAHGDKTTVLGRYITAA